MVFSPAVRGWNVQLSQSPQCTSYIGYTRSRFGKCMRTPLQHDTAFFTAIFAGYGWASGEWSSQHYMRESRNLLAFANNFGGGAWENFNEAWNSDGNQAAFHQYDSTQRLFCGLLFDLLLSRKRPIRTMVKKWPLQMKAKKPRFRIR